MVLSIKQALCAESCLMVACNKPKRNRWNASDWMKPQGEKFTNGTLTNGFWPINIKRPRYFFFLPWCVYNMSSTTGCIKRSFDKRTYSEYIVYGIMRETYQHLRYAAGLISTCCSIENLSDTFLAWKKTILKTDSSTTATSSVLLDRQQCPFMLFTRWFLCFARRILRSSTHAA